MIEKQFNKDRVAFIYITLLTVIAIVYGFTIIPSPAKAQALAFDHKRVVDLGSLQSAIDTYYQTNTSLPKSLSDLSDSSTGYTKLNKTDPKTQQPYEYKITSDTTYKLCTTFATDSTKEDQNLYDSNNPSYSSYTSNFKHPEGYHCFNEKEADYNSNTDYPSVSPSVAISISPAGIDGPADPTVVLTSFQKITSCQWTPYFTLRGFAPNSTITVNSHGTLSDHCQADNTHAYSWTADWNQQTNENGSVTIDYLQGDYGDYTYTFTDSSGNTASIHFSYDQNATVPVILPVQDIRPSGSIGGSAQ